MEKEFNKFLEFHKVNGGTGKIFKFKLIEYREGFLKLKGEFPSETLNPSKTVQGGQINSMLDDVTSILLIYESKEPHTLTQPICIAYTIDLCLEEKLLQQLKL